MNLFNKEVTLEKVKLASPVSIELTYDPKINIHIDKQFGFFLQNIDSTYVHTIREQLIQELATANIHVTESKSAIRLRIDEIILIEKNEEGTDSDCESTMEVDVELYMKGYIYKTTDSNPKLIEADIGTTTTTGLSLFSILFNDSDFDVQKNNTFEEGIAEKNLITLFVKKCVKNIH
ncbi:hypothetical protein RQM59_01795 [Flavobacteriaceae bacterium S356]|uniref:Uncharacterized protein n=1 Tax=Asprobacillus argus TaxID=3076534 RepID=A0ABU3LBP5_9FLAO|nr:hypothetical protein [Flavobacteriaceae bacterium S356]